MPRTNGTYTAPSNSVNPAVAGTNIDASDFNALVDDIETALTESTYTSGLGSTDNRLVRTDGADTKKIQGSAVTCDDSGNLSGVATLTATTVNATSLTNLPLTSYTPTVSAVSGTITAYSAAGSYLAVGSIMFVSISITVTTNGTGAVSLIVSAPTVASQVGTFVGRENALSGDMCQGYIAAAGGVIIINKYNNTYPAADGAVIYLSGFYPI